MEGYKVTRVVGLQRSGEDLVIVIEDLRGQPRAIQLTPQLAQQIFGLLDQALPLERSVAIDPGLSEHVSVARIETEIRAPVDPRSPSSHAIFDIHFRGQDGRGVTLRLPHEEVVTWRDRLTELIDDWVAKKAN